MFFLLLPRLPIPDCPSVGAGQKSFWYTVFLSFSFPFLFVFVLFLFSSSFVIPYLFIDVTPNASAAVDKI